MSTGPQPVESNGHDSLYRAQPAPDQRELLVQLVEEALKSKGVPQGTAQAAAQDADALIQQAARKVPSWVSLAFLFFGVPSLGSFVATARSVWDLPTKVAAIEAELESQRALHKAQAEQLQRIEGLLKADLAGHPASQPARVGDQ